MCLNTSKTKVSVVSKNKNNNILPNFQNEGPQIQTTTTITYLGTQVNEE